MKQILTLLLAVGFFTAAQAQTTRDEARRVILGGGSGSGGNGSSGRDVILGGGNNGESYPYPGNYPTTGSRQSRTDQINRDYENKIQSIRNNPYLSNDEKQRTIRQLERDRQSRIRQLGNNDNYRDYDDDRYDNKHKDNGKHKGWYKKEKNKNWKKGNRD
jgi:hypothetical protein